MHGFLIWKVGNTVFTDNEYGDNFTPDYNQVQYRNGFAPGENITFVVDSNYNGTGRARLKQMGVAIHAKLDGSGGRTKLTSIVEAKNSSGRPSKFKLLATVAGDPRDDRYTTGYFTTKFNNVTINNKPADLNRYPADNDYSTTTKNGNNVEFFVYRR